MKLTDRSGEKAVFAVVGANAFGAEAAPAPGQCRVLPDGSLLAAGTGLALPGMMARARHVRQAALALTVLVLWVSRLRLPADRGSRRQGGGGPGGSPGEPEAGRVGGHARLAGEYSHGRFMHRRRLIV